MTQIDEFESLFKSADKPVFHIEPIKIQKILIVIDENFDESEGYVERLKNFLLVLSSDENRRGLEGLGGRSRSNREVHFSRNDVSLRHLFHRCTESLVK